MNYELAPDLQAKMREIVSKLGMSHICAERVSCIRSRGSKSKRVIARVHGLPVPVQLGMKCEAFYVIEFLERFERCSEQEKIETIIHELLHIPKNFGGGFRHHDYVRTKRVKELYTKLAITGSPSSRLFPKW